MTTLSGKLPAGDGDGLSAIVDELIAEGTGAAPRKIHVAICMVDCVKVTTNADTGETVPTARVRRIEVIHEVDDMVIAEGLMRRALDQRTGREALPYNLEQELRGIFDAPDPETGAGSGLEQPPLDSGEPERDEGPE